MKTNVRVLVSFAVLAILCFGCNEKIAPTVTFEPSGMQVTYGGSCTGTVTELTVLPGPSKDDEYIAFVTASVTNGGARARFTVDGTCLDKTVRTNDTVRLTKVVVKVSRSSDSYHVEYYARKIQ